MFGFFKNKKNSHVPKRAEPGSPVISALLLEGDSFPVDDFLSRMKNADLKVTDVDHGDGKVFTFKIRDELFGLALMPAPYPARDLEGPIATAWMWPPQSSIERVKKHRSHLLITMIGGSGNPVERRLMTTAVTALAAKAPGVAAVYWGEGTLVHYPPLFISFAESLTTPDGPPIHLWVDVRVVRNEEGAFEAFTTGLEPLGHRELEIIGLKMKPGELRDWTVNIISYLLENGPILKDGQTIGVSADQQIPIRYTRSKFGHPGEIIRLG